MAFNQKLARMGQDILDALDQYKLMYDVSYDANRDMGVTIYDFSPQGGDCLLKFVKAPQLGNNQSNPVTGLVEEVFTPHIIKVMPSSGAHAFDTLTVNTPAEGAQATGFVAGLNVLATDTVVINGVTYTCIAGVPVPHSDDFQFSGTSDADTIANLVYTINNSTTNGGVIVAEQNVGAPTQADLWVRIPGIAGNALTIADGGALKFTASAATFLNGVDGDTFAVNGSTYYCVVAGSWNNGFQPFFLLGATDADTIANIRPVVDTIGSFFVYTKPSVPPAVDTFDVVALVGGTGGNAITTANSGGGLTWSGALTLQGGTDQATSAAIVAKVLAECFTKGSQVDVYTSDVYAGWADFVDMVDANLLWSYRNLSWGNLSHM